MGTDERSYLIETAISEMRTRHGASTKEVIAAIASDLTDQLASFAIIYGDHAAASVELVIEHLKAAAHRAERAEIEHALKF